LGAALAVFYRTDLKDRELVEYRQAHRIDFVEEAFRTPAAEQPAAREWPRPPSFYQKYLTVPKWEAPPALQRAQHTYAHVMAAQQRRIALSPALAAALAYQTIRQANEGLAANPQVALGYRLLGETYQVLSTLEAQIGAVYQTGYDPRLRYYQAVHAYSQSLVIEPDNALAHWGLWLTYSRNFKHDVALRALNEYDRLMEDADEIADPAEVRKQRFSDQEKLSAAVANIAGQIATELERGTDRLAIAQFAYQQGFVLEALKLLEADAGYVNQNLQAQLLLGVLLMEAGRTEEADETLRRLQGPGEQFNLPLWRAPAGLAALGNAEYGRAVVLLNEETKNLETQTLATLLQTIPLVSIREGWPVQRTTTAMNALYQFPDEFADLQYNVALCHLESGQPAQATATFQRILETNPETPLRPLIRFYLELLTKERIPPFDWIPVGKDLFLPEEGTKKENGGKAKPGE
jgi:tetratricopeptide (TPR) repeat protein